MFVAWFVFLLDAVLNEHDKTKAIFDIRPDIRRVGEVERDRNSI